MSTGQLGEGPYAVPYLQTAPDGQPALHGCRCAQCGQSYLGARTACARCGSRADMPAEFFARYGTLYNFTVVHRSFPGVKTPFVMAIVDIDDGPTVRGTLTNVKADASQIEFGTPVEVVVEESPQLDDGGRNFRTFHFIPRKSKERT